MIAKRFGTYVSLKNLGLSLGEIHCSPRKIVLPRGTIMVPRKRSLSCHREQVKLFFPRERSCPFGKKSLSCPREQPCSLGNKCV